MLRHTHAFMLLALFFASFYAQFSTAHPDLEAQIESLSMELSTQPDNVDLLIKRGDLYRRHGDWDAAATDFQSVRNLNPDQMMIDWYEGRLFVASGRYEQAEDLLTRFLENEPVHTGAYQARARARLALGQAHLAAGDFRSAIDNSKRPSPSLYRSLVLSLVASGRDHAADALLAVDEGLGHFSTEVSLLGLGADLSLAQSNPQRSHMYMSTVPMGLQVLPQWQFRQALQVCIEGDRELADRLFAALLMQPTSGSRQKAGTWRLPTVLADELMTSTESKNCSKVAWEVLRQQSP